MPVSEVRTRHQTALAVPRALIIADCTDPHALAFGVTGELHASIDRSLTQAWAMALAAAGFAGVRYLVRHDPSQRQIGVPIFGAVGEAAWPVRSTAPIAADLIRDVERVFDVQVR